MKNLTIEQLNESITKIRDLSEMTETETMDMDDIINAMHEEMDNINYSFVTINEKTKVIEVIPAYNEILCFVNERAYLDSRHFILNNPNVISIPYVGRFKDLEEQHYLINNSQFEELENIFNTTFM